MVVAELMQVGAPAILIYVVVCLNRYTKLVRGEAGWHIAPTYLNLIFLPLGQQDRDFVEYFAGKAEFSANMWKVLALGFLLLF